MKYRLLRFSLLSMLVMLCGGSAWAITNVLTDTPDVTYDLTDGNWSVSNGTLTNGTVSFSGAGSDNFKMNTGYFMMGKKDAYIEFPAYEEVVSKIVVIGRDGASGSTGMNIFVNGKAASTATTGCTGTNTYLIDKAYQAVGTKYTLKVTSNHNAQITKIEVYFDSSNKTATTVKLADGYATTGIEGNTIDLPTATVMAGTEQVAGASVTWKSSDENVAKIEDNKISLLTPGTTTITASYAGNDTYNSSSTAYELTVTEVSVEGLASMVIIFKDSGNDSDSGTKVSSIDKIISEGSDYVSEIPTATNVYNGRTGRGLKLGANGGGATLKLTLAKVVKPIKITFDAMQYNTTETSITVNGKAITNLGNTLATYSIIYDGKTEVSEISISTPAKRAYITNVKIYYEGEVDNRTATTVAFAEGYATSGTVGQPINLPTATVMDSENAVSGATVTWTSSDETVATIGDGVINPLKAGTTTIKASYAGDDTYKPSDESYTLTVSEAPYTSLQALQGAATTTSTPIAVTFNNVKVVYVNGDDAFLADENGYGVQIHTSNHGLEAGNFLSGTINCNLQLYRGTTQILNFSKEGLTISKVGISPAVKTLPLTSVNQSTLVTLKGLTYNSSNQTFGDGTNTIKFYDKFKTNVVLENGKAYDVTGIVVLYNDVIEISPRTANDISEIITTAGALNAAAIAAGEEEKAVTFNFTNVKVVYAKYGYYYLADDDNSGYALLKGSQYGTEAEMTTGSLITGTFTGTVSAKNGTPQASANSFSLTSKTADPNPRTPTTITIDQLENNVNNYIKIENAELVQRLGNDITFKVGETTFKAYNSFALNVTLEEDKAYNIIGFGNYHAAPGNPIYYQILPTEITEVSTTPDPFYILGVNDLDKDSEWDIPAEFVEMTWDAENEVYTYELNNTTDAYFCFSTNNEVSDWDTFNSTYRWATLEGNVEYRLDWLGVPLQLQKVNGTIVLPAGEWTISVTADKIMTITGEATPITPTEAQYYVVGSMTNWAVDEAYKMSVNEESETPEYSFTMDLNTDDQFKVVKVEEGKDNVWYPDGEGNAYGENGEIPADGEYTIYFRPNGDGGDDWFYNLIYAAFNGEPVVGFRDIKLDLTVQGFLTDDEYNNKSAVTAKLLVNEEGNISRNDEATEPNATVTGNTRKDSHGWDNFTMTAPVTGIVKITVGGCEYNNSSKNVLTVTPEGGEAFTIEAPKACWHINKTKNFKSGYFDAGENLVTLTITGPEYTPYVAIEAVDEIPSTYTITYAKDSNVEGTVPAEVEVTIGEAITLPKNYTLYKEGYTQTGWTDGTTTYELGGSFTPEDDVTLTAVFTENTVNLVDRTEAVTVTFPLNGYNDNPQHKLNNGGIIVTQVTIGESSIDVKADVTGSLVANGYGWHLASNSCTISVPSCKGASMTVTTYSDPSNAIKFENNAPKSVTGTENPYTASYETASTDATLAIDAASDIYISNIAITLPVVSGDEPTEDIELFSWVYDASTTALDAVINGTNGSVTLKNTGTDAFSAEGATYSSKIADDMAPTKGLKFGKNTQYIVISLTEGKFQAGDEITVCGYNEIMFCTSADRTSTIGDVATGSSKSDYKVGTFTIPEDFTAQSTLYIFRKNGSGTGIAAIQAIRPGHDPNFVATPVITPATGTYASEKEVTITCETEDANIYYTLDGTDPTSQSTAYNDAFTVTETTTVKAIAIKGDNSSEIAESVITIVNIQPGESNLEWDYTDKNIPEEKEDADPMYEDNGLFYASFVNDKVGENVQNNGMNGVKLNSSGKAWFAKNPVAGKLTLTFGFRKSNDAFSVNVYECSIDGNTANRGNLIDAISVDASPGTGSINIPAEVTGVWIERKTTSGEGVLSKIVFKETVPRTFQSFEITNEQLKGTIADMNLPEGVTLTGTQPAANNNAHGYSGATIVVPTDGGAVKFTIGGCQYNNGTFTVKNSNNETLATLSNKTTKCYHQDGSVVTYFYTGEATTLTFSTIENLPYFKAEAVDVEEVTVTYKDQNGEVLGTKKVIEGSAIGEAPYTEADLTIAEGYAFRGWIYTNGVKVKATDTVDGNKTVMASVTAIEEAPTTGSIQVYDLTQSTFYPEDHENFDVNGGSFHDGQHGFSFGNGQSFSVKVSSKAQVVVTLCQHSNEGTVTVKDANNNPVGEGFNAKVASCGETAVVKYEGEATTLTFTFAATAYIHNVKVFNVNEFPEKDEATGYYMVPAGDAVALVLAINSASAEANSKIFLPNATYDLGELVKTTISGTNVSIIGESMDGVIIKNKPTTEGIDVTATLLNTSSNLYMQDLTIECDAPWITNAERGVTLQDKGNQTILKNVYLKGKQDTYYSNNPSGTFYFEDGKIQGSVDYVCGNGDVYFNKTSFYTVNKSTGGKGGCIAAPNTLKSFGYIFSDCTLDGVENEDGQYRLARPWAADTKCFFVNTTMKIKPNAAGWSEWSPAHAVTQFAEYNSIDANGDAIDLTGRATTIGGQPNNPVLTEGEAAALAVDQIFAGDWKPQVIAQQVAAPAAKLSEDGKKITWTPANDGATAYALFKDGKFLGITTGSEWTIEEVAPGAPRRAESTETSYSIRAANSRGGFGKAKIVSGEADGITNINAEQNGDVKIYDLQGRQVKTATKGVYIINGKKTIFK